MTRPAFSILSPKALALGLTLSLLAGCASFNQLSNEVSSWGELPKASPERPTTFVFERLPSQQSGPQQEAQAQLEAAALPALQGAGWKAGEGDAQASVAPYQVQLGVRVALSDRYAQNSLDWRTRWTHRPLAWGGYGAYGPFGPAFGPWRHDAWFALRSDQLSYAREVVLLVRDRASNQVVFESRASNEGMSSDIGPILPAMFRAALSPNSAKPNTPRTVVVPIEKATAPGAASSAP